MVVDCAYRSPYDERLQRYTDFDDGTTNNSGKEYPYTKNDQSIGAKAHSLAIAQNIVAVEFEGKTAPHDIIQRFVDEVIPKIRSFKPDVILWSLGVDSAMGDPYGGLGNLPSSFYTMIRGMRMAFPLARHGGVMEGGYLPENWPRCINPALLGLHVSPEDSKDRSAFFRRYKSHFRPE
jgi:acetoin utilization deacetylase AcuC-like enzyme